MVTLTMHKFGRGLESDPAEQARLDAFIDSLYRDLVPGSGESATIQGELIRAHARLTTECYREGMGNYYDDELDPNDTFADSPYGQLAVFLLDTLIANRGEPLEADDVAAFAAARRDLEPNWHWRRSVMVLTSRAEGTTEPPLSDAEERELAQLEDAGPTIGWETLLDRAQRCVANWCIAHPDLLDRTSKRPLASASAPIPTTPCPRCEGRGWIDPRGFAELCPCNQPRLPPDR